MGSRTTGAADRGSLRELKSWRTTDPRIGVKSEPDAITVTHPPTRALGGLLLAGSLVLLGHLYFVTQRTVWLEVNGTQFAHRTHERTVSGILRELEINLQAEDTIVIPPLSEEGASQRRASQKQGVADFEPIRITVARRVVLLHDGVLSSAATHARTVRDALKDFSHVEVAEHDQLSIWGAPCDLETPLPQPDADSSLEPSALVEQLAAPIQLSIRRAVLLNVQDDALEFSMYTTAQTVAEALHERGLIIYEGDYVFPDLHTRISPGLNVSIERSKPIVLDVAGDRWSLRTRLLTVRDVLEQQQVNLGIKDYVVPEPRTSIASHLELKVVRVRDEYLVEDTMIPFETRVEADSDLELDTREVTSWGQEGILRRRIRVHYENEQEVYRTQDEEWVAREATDHVTGYGTKIVLRELGTPEGTITYWRKVRMLATSYNAATAGTSPSSPHYGLTRVGIPARKGLVAVDPSVVRLWQRVYVPGYGTATAADTGSGIIGMRIDLCYDDDNLVHWSRWVDVYLLAPAPPPSQILYTLPGTPVER